MVKRNKNRKQPKIRSNPSVVETPKFPKLDPDSETILFCFNSFDESVKLTKSRKANNDDFWDISSKLKEFERMTWDHLIQNMRLHHPINVDKIHKDAQKSLLRLNLDDTDDVWSFRLNGENRLWGIQHGRYFIVTWWDPEHLIYEVPKRNT